MAADILSALKVNLGIRSTGYDDRLSSIISAAQEYIETEGITLNLESDGDLQIVVMYAEYLWRHRETGEGMPRMLRYTLNNRLFSEKMKTE